MPCGKQACARCGSGSISREPFSSLSRKSRTIVNKSMLPCAILCGGLATRLRPMTEKIPKSLIAINGEPFIAHQLRLLLANGIERIVLCTGYLGELIEDFVGDGSKFGVNVRYSFDGAQLLGTGGAI